MDDEHHSTYPIVDLKRSTYTIATNPFEKSPYQPVGHPFMGDNKQHANPMSTLKGRPTSIWNGPAFMWSWPAFMWSRPAAMKYRTQ